MMFTQRVWATLLVLAAAVSARAAEGDADAAHIVRADGSTVPVVKITRDDYAMVSGMLKGGAPIHVKSCNVADVLYAGRDANFLAAIEKREAGKNLLAAMYFQHAAETLPHAAWVDEQCNFGIAEALFQYGAFSGFKGRGGVSYSPPSHYYQLALQANPKSRFGPLIAARRVVCLVEEGEFDKAGAEMAEAERLLKSYRDEVVRIDSKFVPLTDRAQARLALAGGTLAARKAGAKKGTWEQAREAYHAAVVRSEGMGDFLAEAADGELNAMIAMKSYSLARAVAERWIERFRGAAGVEDGRRAILGTAYLALEKCHFADATELKARGQEMAAQDAFAQARWALLHVVAEYFDSEAQVAAAHYFSGLCYERLSGVEGDAAERARREWRTVVEKFAKSDFKELAEKELLK